MLSHSHSFLRSDKWWSDIEHSFIPDQCTGRGGGKWMDVHLFWGGFFAIVLGSVLPYYLCTRCHFQPIWSLLTASWILDSSVLETGALLRVLGDLWFSLHDVNLLHLFVLLGHSLPHACYLMFSVFLPFTPSLSLFLPSSHFSSLFLVTTSSLEFAKLADQGCWWARYPLTRVFHARGDEAITGYISGQTELHARTHTHTHTHNMHTTHTSTYCTCTLLHPHVVHVPSCLKVPPQYDFVPAVSLKTARIRRMSFCEEVQGTQTSVSVCVIYTCVYSVLMT